MLDILLIVGTPSTEEEQLFGSLILLPNLPVNIYIYFPFVTTINAGLPPGYSVAGMGYDQMRNFLYTVPTLGNIAGHLASCLYDRYVISGVQLFTSAALTITGTLITVATIWYDIIIEPDTGYSIVTTSRVNLFDSSVLASITLPASTGTNPFSIAHANDGNIRFLNNFGTLFVVTNTATLALAPTGGVTLGSPVDFADPLFNN